MNRLYSILPVKKSTLVIGRYTYAISLGIVFLLFYLAVGVCAMIYFHDPLTVSNVISAAMSGAVMFAVSSAFQLPGFYKYGAIRGTHIYVYTFYRIYAADIHHTYTDHREIYNIPQLHTSRDFIHRCSRNDHSPLWNIPGRIHKNSEKQRDIKNSPAGDISAGEFCNYFCITYLSFLESKATASVCFVPGKLSNGFTKRTSYP